MDAGLISLFKERNMCDIDDTLLVARLRPDVFQHPSSPGLSRCSGHLWHHRRRRNHWQCSRHHCCYHKCPGGYYYTNKQERPLIVDMWLLFPTGVNLITLWGQLS